MTATGAGADVRWRLVGVFLGAQSVSLVGNQVFFIAVAWAAAQLGGTGAVTAVTLAAALPRALMMVFGGPICDALGPRAVLLRTTVGRSVALAVAATAALLTDSLALLLVISVVEGALLGLASPSFGTVLPRLVAAGGLDRANSVRAMTSRLAPIFGSPLGAWLIATGHLSAALAVVSAACAVSWAGVFTVTRGIPKPAGAAKRLWRRWGDGFRLLRANPRLRWLFLAALSLDLAFAWPLNPALPTLAIERGWGVGAVGTVIAAFGGGAFASAALGAALADRIPLLVRLVGCAAGIAVGLTAMVLVSSLPAMAAVAAFVGVCSGQNGPALVTLYQQAAPEDRLGTAMSMLALSGIGAAPLAYAVFGTAAALAGTSATWLACGVLAAAAPLAGLRALRVPASHPQPVV